MQCTIRHLIRSFLFGNFTAQINRMSRIIYFLLVSVFLLGINDLSAQDDNLIQFSGVVLDADSLLPIPYTSIIVMNKKRGTSTDMNGIFSFVAEKGDSLKFSSVGFRTEYFVIPDTLTVQRYSWIQILATDTVLLKTHMVYPWPSKEQFRQEFLNTRIPEDDLDRANRNLAQAQMRDQMRNMPMAGGGANFKYEQGFRNEATYYQGQYPSWSVLNPVAWAQFIDAWNKGEFKKK
jgi:hypothetical protein